MELSAMFVERMTCKGMKPNSQVTEIHINRQGTRKIGYIAYMYNVQLVNMINTCNDKIRIQVLQDIINIDNTCM